MKTLLKYCFNNIPISYYSDLSDSSKFTPSVVVVECCFSVEAKAFCFTMKEGSSNLWLEERRKGFVGVIIVGLQSSVWLVAMVGEAFLSHMKEDRVKCFHEDEKVLIVGRGGNKAGRFLEVAVYVEAGQKGII
jgi:hypothetical protein